MATIRQRNGHWQCIIKRKGYPTLSKTFELRKDAERWGRQQERAIDAGQWMDRTEAEQTTLGDLLKRYSLEVSSKKRGADVEMIRIEALRRSKLALFSVAGVTSQRLAEWRDQRLEEVSGSTVSRELTLISHVFSVAIREWGFALQNNPVSLIRKPAFEKPRDRVLTEEQRLALLTSVGRCRNHWIRPVVVFALETAARRGEILSLRWDDIDMVRKVAKVSGKTGCRNIPLSPTCISLLKSLPRSHEGRVFPVTAETLKQAYKRAVDRSGIEDFTFHDLRHDALTRLAKMGFNILELRTISGHATANMLQRYVSIDAGDLAGRLAGQKISREGQNLRRVR
ncbi:tyrosine-type recombinase/integrase [Propionivibrio dicarboxylicus]|uniref:Site-specific recombinase XerD n=1 Tax=Propionivibrio dicarboxylicus TaxID=83767 RepID=A0A1G8JKN9_9RHOO|nr:site-specific integrase [Propionivibrio dicarboxylicus]SDI31834.1 Site-specific recombinase XerD [Propionivibrio dicarboxylicus]